MNALAGLAERVRRRPAGDGAFDRRLVAPLVLGAVLNPVNSSMIAIALVPIGLALGVSAAQTAWLVSGLYVATAIGQPVVGRLVDRYGVRPVYLGATALVGVAGVIGATAPNLAVLVLARVVLGLGTCAGYPAAMSLIRREARRTGVDSPSGILALLTVAAQTVSVVGPSLGGILIAVTGWRGIFAVNVPLAVACLVLGRARLPVDPPVRRTRSWWADLDVPGMLLFAVMLMALMVVLMQPSARTALLLLVVAGFGAALVRRESRVADPFLDVGPLLTNRPLQLTYLRQLLAMTVSYSFLYGFTQWLEAGHGLSASQTGLLLLLMPLTAIGVTALTGRSPEVRRKLLVGSALQVVSCALLLTVGPTTPVVALLGIGLLVGIPQGLNNLANQTALYHQADPARTGSSAGLLRTFMYLGAILAAAANAAAYGEQATTSGLHVLAVALTGVALLFLIVVLVDRSLAAIGRPTPAEQPAPTSATTVEAGDAATP